ncbi:MAG: DUF4832 domain-containing protein [Clostridiales bacterium]|jgi:hypothetical protein|nr:DUF4832 domain-containing protein [Clostridiales bacterium]
MMKQTMRVLLITAIAAVLLPLGGVAVVRANSVNLLREVSVSVTASTPPQDGFGLSYMTDGRYDWVGQAFVAKHGSSWLNDALAVALPHEFIFDFGRTLVEVSELNLYAFLARDYGVRRFALYYYSGGDWVQGYDSGSFTWSTHSDSAAELKTFSAANFPPTTKIKFEVTSKYLFSTYYRIDELELMGSVAGTEVWTPSTVFHPYVSAPASAPPALPPTVSVIYDSGEAGEEAVVWEAAAFDGAGVYRVNGVLSAYPAVAASCFAEIYSEENAYRDTAGETAEFLRLLAGKVFRAGEEFQPGEQFTRLDAARAVFYLTSLAPVYETPYQDVGTEAFYYPVVAAVAKAGIFASGGDFRPDAPVTVNQLIAILNQATGAGLAPYSDANCDRAAAARLVAEAVYGDTRGKRAANFTDGGRALQNPDMGFAVYYYDNSTRIYDAAAPNHELFTDVPGANTIYLRLPWKHIEPEKGVFNWSFIDTQIQRFADVGKSVTIGITCAETGVKYATPEWVRNDGADGVLWTVGGGPTTNENNSLWMPYFDDPVFLAHLEDMLRALARKYDGSPRVAGVDIRSIGVWGEGHTSTSQVAVSDATIRTHLALYERYFSETPVFTIDEHLRGSIREDAARRGFGYRDDSLVGNYTDNTWWHPEDSFMAEPFWRTAPVFLETLHMFEIGAEWTDGADLLRAMEDYHASYLSIHHYAKAFYQFNREFMEKANGKIGYRLYPKTAVWDQTVLTGGKLSLTLRWTNGGTAPFYKDGWPVITVRNAAGEPVARFEKTEFHLGGILPGEEKTQTVAEALPPGLAAGTYSLYVEATRSGNGGEVDLPLPLTDGEKRYYLGDFDVAPPSEPLLAEIVTDPRESGYFADGAGAVTVSITSAGGTAIIADAYLTVNDSAGTLLLAQAMRSIEITGTAGEPTEQKVSFALPELYPPGGEVRLYLFSAQEELMPLTKRKTVLLR